LRWFTDNDNSAQSDMIGYCLQCISKELEKLPIEIKRLLDPDLKTEMNPFLTSTFMLDRQDELKKM
jgi:hypothetical protein